MKRFIPLLLLTGCAIGPDYKEPTIIVAEQYVEQQGGEESPQEEAWWSDFNDETLTTLIDRATAESPSLHAALARIQQARAHYRHASAELWPEVNANAQAIRQRISQNLFDSPFFGPPDQSYFQVGFDALWELDIFGKRRRAQQAAWYEFEAEQDATRYVYITLLSDIARTYIELRATQQALSIWENRVALERELFSLATARELSGLTSAIERADALATLRSAEQSLNAAQTGERQAIFRLAALVGERPESLEPAIATRAPLPMPTKQRIAAVPSELLKQRPDIRRAERLMAAQSASIGAAIGELYPSITLGADYAYQSNAIDKLLSPVSRAWSVGPGIKWAILHFGRIRANIKTAKARYQEAFHTYEQTVLDALRDVESAFAAYYSQLEALIDAQSELEAREEVAHFEEAKYKSGLTSYPDALLAKRIALETALTELEARRTLSTDFIALYKALGGGWQCSD